MDAHQNEYLAAAAGMNDTYGLPYKHGDRIAFRLKSWSETSWDAGNVINTHNGKLLVRDRHRHRRGRPSPVAHRQLASVLGNPRWNRVQEV